jgi:hypothetical protein
MKAMYIPDATLFSFILLALTLLFFLLQVLPDHLVHEGTGDPSGSELRGFFYLFVFIYVCHC